MFGTTTAARDASKQAEHYPDDVKRNVLYAAIVRARNEVLVKLDAGVSVAVCEELEKFRVELEKAGGVKYLVFGKDDSLTLEVASFKPLTLEARMAADPNSMDDPSLELLKHLFWQVPEMLSADVLCVKSGFRLSA